MFNNNEKFELQKKYIVLRQETKVIERYIELHINKLYHVIIKLLLSFHAVTRKTSLLYNLSTIYFKTYIFIICFTRQCCNGILTATDLSWRVCYHKVRMGD